MSEVTEIVMEKMISFTAAREKCDPSEISIQYNAGKFSVMHGSKDVYGKPFSHRELSFFNSESRKK